MDIQKASAELTAKTKIKMGERIENEISGIFLRLDERGH